MKILQFILIVSVICFPEMIKAQGQIGIGTATPDKQLHITGALKLPETSHADTGIIYLGSDRFIHNYHPFGSVFLNTFIGRNAGNLQMFGLYPTDGRNTGIGANALFSIKHNTYSTAIGADALKNDTAGYGNTAVGAETMRDRTEGNNNTGTGYRSMYKNETGNYNSAFGSNALYSNADGSFNTAIGNGANSGSSYGDSNTCLGYLAGYGSNFTGFNNGVLIGALSGYSLYDGTNNIVIGYRAGYDMADCDNNIVIGARALKDFSLGHNNIVIGHRTGQTYYVGSNTILIGYNIDYPGDDSSMSIGNLIFGNKIDGTGNTVSTGNIGIGVANPTTFRLEVDGSVGPSADNIKTLGSGAKRWRTVYAKIIETDSINGNAVSGAIIPDGFSQGPVVFGGTSGVLEQSSQFFWNNASQRLGIGTASPGQQLEITANFQLPLTSSGSAGVIYKQGNRFIHDYKPASSDGYNTFMGINSGNFAISGSGLNGSRNTGFGYETLMGLTSGYSNTGVGYHALKNAGGTYENTAIGAGVMGFFSSGNENTAIGISAMYTALGNYNVALGARALYGHTGDNNVALGRYAMYTGQGESNIAVGSNALYGISGQWRARNIAIGYNAGYSTSTGSNNIFIGWQTGSNNTTGSNNILLGHYIEFANTGANNQLSIGNLIFGTGLDGTGTSISSGNIGIGTNNPGLFKLQVEGHIGPDDDAAYDLGSSSRKWRAVYSSYFFGTIHPMGLTQNCVTYGGSTGDLSFESEFYYEPSENRLTANEINIPNKLLMTYTSSSSTGIIFKNYNRFIHDYISPGTNGKNTFVGLYAGNFTMSGAVSDDASYNTGIGHNALTALTSGQNNTAVGTSSLVSNNSGDYNTALGAYALEGNSSGNYNVAIGYKALEYSQTLSRNVAIGFLSNPSNAAGNDNVTVGSYILSSTNCGEENTIVGSEAAWGGDYGYTPAKNTIMGFQAGYNVTGATGNILLGYKSGDNISGGDYNILIGYEIDAQSGAGNQQLSIGNLIFGTNMDGTGTTVSSGNVGIGVASPDYKLQVNGTLAPEVDQQALGTPGLRWDGNFYDATVDGVLDFSEAPAYPKIYNQSSEPDIPDNTFAFWFKSSTDVYIILDIAGTQKKALMGD